MLDDDQDGSGPPLAKECSQDGMPKPDRGLVLLAFYCEKSGHRVVREGDTACVTPCEISCSAQMASLNT